MHSLQKTGAIAGALAIAACWPLAVGQLAQKQIEKQFTQFDDSRVKLELVSYERGYLSSLARSNVTVIDPNLKAILTDAHLPTEFAIKHDISHGIWSVSSDNEFEMENPIPLDLKTTTYITGSTDLDIKLGAYKQVFDDASQLDIKPLTADVALGSDGKVEMQYHSEGLKLILNQDESFTAAAFEGYADGYRQGNFWIGKQGIKASDLDFTNAKTLDALTVKNLDYGYQTSLGDDQTRLSNQSIATLDSLDYQGLNFKDLKLDFGVKDIDAQSFIALVELVNKAQNPNQEDSQRAFTYLNQIMQQGFETGLNNFEVSLGEGKVKSAINIAVPENAPSPVSAPFKFISAITLDTDTLISEEILLQFPELKPKFEKLLKMKMMEKTDEGYLLKGKLEDGTMTFSNGQTMPYMMLGAAFL